jgi:hypothetical protein
MRTLPVDTTALRLLATGSVQPVAVWAELSNGERRPVPGKQETDDYGVPLWNVELIAPPAEEGERAELLSVRVAADEQPTVAEFEPVAVEGMTVRVSVNKRTGALGMYWAAADVKAVSSRTRSMPAPTSSSAAS